MNNTHETIFLPTFTSTIVSGNAKDGFQTVSKSLADYVAQSDKGLILYFYPKDNTAGCSTQATDFSTHLQALSDLGYTVLGVSRDGIGSHENFITKKELSIPLISDTDEMLCQHFDVIKEKMMYGKTHLGIVRSTFVFDKTGNMTHSFRNVKAKEHVAHLMTALTKA
ncbi:peroxiredoxin [Moraxella nasovis]|uniref:peroxiredoxin n=1 Tax=Moraxella nasovis TaxID=2904121 RepID=UPI001F618689|nr:peroxiredoxin [Moraxella nasovis]UNU73468.1 peroxiredoxin [Moraxella nasovis]